MKRAWLLGGLIAIGGLSMSLAAYQAAPAPKVIEVEKIKDNLFVLKGGGGNTAVFVGSNGITVVDTKNPGWGQPILDKIKELSSKPVVRIINTHTHGDHVSGNVEFPATVDVVVQENTKTNMQRMAPVTGLNQPPTPNIFTQNNGRGMAKQTFKDRMTLGSGADQIDLYYFGRGHTNGDAWVVWPALRVMHAGDIFSGKTAPILDANNGGSGVEIGNSLTKGADTIKNVDVIITGHGTQMTMADLREYAQFNKDFLEFVRNGVAAGKSVDAMTAEYKVPAKYAGYTAAEARVKSNVEVIASELKK
ncbi:MAG: MBL fold metallo-hydrolase [Acidobacteria bacterium]|nr:MBL fold metallo-hydrolase [Acidobacteriota bacterium]